MTLEPELISEINTTTPTQYQGPNVIKRIVRKVRVHSVCKRPYYPKSKCKDVTNDPFILYCLGSRSTTTTGYKERRYLRIRRRVRALVVRLVCLVRSFFFTENKKKEEKKVTNSGV